MNTLSYFWVVDVAKSADADVITGQIKATFSVLRTIVCTLNALVHIDAQPESGGPLITALMTFAAHINLIRPERLEIAILVPVQRTFSMRCKQDQRWWLVRLRMERFQEWLIVRTVHVECKRAKLDRSKVFVMFVVDKTRISSVLMSLEFTISDFNLSTQILIVYADNTNESIVLKLKLKDYYTARTIFPKYLKI